MDFTHTRVFRIASLAIALGLLSGPANEISAQDIHAGRQCSAATLEGAYGFYRTGTATYGVVAAQGRIVFDGEAGWYSRMNISRNGEIFQDEDWEGGYTVNPDCTGELDGAHIVIVDGGNGYYLLSPIEGFAVYEVGTRIHTGPGNRDDH